MRNIVTQILKKILEMSNDRKNEYRFAVSQAINWDKLLDVGCGTGTFLEFADKKGVGIDINSENIKICLEKGLECSVGDALNLPFPNETFDFVHCSHLIQVFNPRETVDFFREITRVTKYGGVIVITTLTDFDDFWQHPENVRPYPPDALRRLFRKAASSQSPMFENLPSLVEIRIRFRKPALFELRWVKSNRWERFSSILVATQSIIGLKKYWTYNSYSISFKKM